MAIDHAMPVLVVGGGIAGMSAAILLRRIGIPVRIIEQDPDWRVYGAGISITGPTYRAMARLGIAEEVCALGFGSTDALRIHNAAGIAVADVPTQPTEPGLPSAGGILRPVLHGILRERTLRAAVEVQLGVCLTDLREDADGVEVRLSNGEAARYQAVIGADGAYSSLRARLFPEVPPPAYTGQYCYRLSAARRPAVAQPHFYMAGHVTAGLMPVSDDAMYMWLLDNQPVKVRVPDAALPSRLAAIMAPFGGLLGELRDELGPASSVVARPLDVCLLPRPWYRGRVLLIGDAAHATTPHLASGAGIAIEDALVLAETVAEADDVATAFDRFMDRRFERARMVVERSVEIGALQQAHGAPEQLKALMAAAEAALRENI